MGWWNHGFQIPSQDQGQGEAPCKRSSPKNVLDSVFIRLRSFFLYFILREPIQVNVRSNIILVARNPLKPDFDR